MSNTAHIVPRLGLQSSLEPHVMHYGCGRCAPRSRILAPTLMAAVSNERLCGCAAVGPDDDRPVGQRSRAFYLLPPGGFVGALPLPWLAKGEAGAASFGFSFFGFLASRLPRFSPLAMAYLRCGSVSGWVGFSVARRLSSR